MILFGVLAASAAGCLCALCAASVPLPAVPRVAVPPFVRRVRSRFARGRLAAASLAILQATHAGLRTGMPLPAALRVALAPQHALARAPFDAALRAFELNADLDDALEAARRHAIDPRVATALDALALVAAEDLPSARAAALVGSVTERLAFEEHLREEIDARASGARMQIAILALVVPALATYLVLTVPALGATLATPIGAHVLVPAAVLLEAAGILLSRSIVSGLEL